MYSRSYVSCFINVNLLQYIINVLIVVSNGNDAKKYFQKNKNKSIKDTDKSREIRAHKIQFYHEIKVFDGSTALDTCRTLIGPFLQKLKKAHLLPFFPLISSHYPLISRLVLPLPQTLIPKIPLGKLL